MEYNLHKLILSFLLSFKLEISSKNPMVCLKISRELSKIIPVSFFISFLLSLKYFGYKFSFNFESKIGILSKNILIFPSKMFIITSSKKILLALFNFFIITESSSFIKSKLFII